MARDPRDSKRTTRSTNQSKKASKAWRTTGAEKTRKAKGFDASQSDSALDLETVFAEINAPNQDTLNQDTLYEQELEDRYADWAHNRAVS